MKADAVFEGGGVKRIGLVGPWPKWKRRVTNSKTWQERRQEP
jgi:hypothetical protein